MRTRQRTVGRAGRPHRGENCHSNAFDSPCYASCGEVSGSEKAALKQAAKFGARAVKLYPAQVEIQVPIYDWSDGQRYIGTETKSVPGHSVSLYLNR